MFNDIVPHRPTAAGLVLRVVVFAAAVNNLSCSRDPAVPEKIGKSDQEILKLAVNLGPIIVPKARGQVEHAFEIRNPSSEKELVLKRGFKSCGCLAVEPEQLRIAPEEIGILKVRFELPVESSQFRQIACYDANLDRPAQVCLTVEVDAYSSLAVEPRWPPEAKVLLGESPAAEFEVIVATEADSNRLPIQILGSPLAVEARELNSHESFRGRIVLHKTRYRLTVPPQPPLKGASTNISFRCGKSIVYRTLRWKSHQRVTATPTHVFVRSSPQSKSPIKINLKGDSPFRIVGAQVSPPSVTLISNELRTVSREHELLFEIGQVFDTKIATRGQISVEVEFPEPETILIPLYILHDSAGSRKSN